MKWDWIGANIQSIHWYLKEFKTNIDKPLNFWCNEKLSFSYVLKAKFKSALSELSYK